MDMNLWVPNFIYATMSAHKHLPKYIPCVMNSNWSLNQETILLLLTYPYRIIYTRAYTHIHIYIHAYAKTENSKSVRYQIMYCYSCTKKLAQETTNVKFILSVLTHFFPMFSFHCTLKTPENQRFSWESERNHGKNYVTFTTIISHKATWCLNGRNFVIKLELGI